MKIWLCKQGETIPITQNSRIYRVGMLAKYLRKNNHEVIWWTSKFDHNTKRFLEEFDELPDGTKMKYLNGIAYKKNLSVQRILNHHQMGVNFSNEAGNMLENEKPDIIYVSMPTLDFAYRSVKFGKENSIKTIVDIRDLWPDVFLDLIPLRFLRKETFLMPWNKKLKYVLKNASLVVGITDEYIKWAQNKVKPFMLKNTITLPLGYTEIDLNKIEENENRKFTISFAGTIGQHFDLATIFKVAKRLEKENIHFNILGSGDLLENYKGIYGELKNISFYGWVNQDKITEVLLNSDLGIAPYKNTINFINNIPNKPYEYLAHGLPILTCLTGATRNLLKTQNVGYFYEEGNVDSLIKEIIKILDNKEDLLRKKNNSKLVFRENYSSDIIYSRFVEIIEEIL